MLIDDRTVDKLCLCCDDAREDMLFWREDIWDVDRLCANISALFLVWDGARFGMFGASSLERLSLDGFPK
jgi:hypothetical protein